ncbi:Sec-independent protein translocase protein TatAt [uncultured archaeon]|nr:Sec-independent protein translocase protein TatAt [uncultured archaeon]
MAIGPQEILFIFVIVILIFGASKIPELARSLGKATGEFKKGKQEAEIEIKDIEKSIKEGKPPEDRAAKIKKMARDLGIPAEGKTDEQLLDEIQKKMPTIR